MDALAILCFAAIMSGEQKKEEEPRPPIQNKENKIVPEAEAQLRNYIFTVVLVDGADQSIVKEATVYMYYAGDSQQKQAVGGRVSFKFRTDAAKVTVRVDAPGRDIYNTEVRLTSAEVEHRAALNKTAVRKNSARGPL